ncbi:polymorphic transmembrane cluster 2 transmembrane protein 5, partial [Biomphalaria pfeifferi]
PSIQLQNCLNYVEQNTIVKCSCKIKSLGSNNATYNWFNASSNVLLSNTSLLTFPATKYDS